ncbi:MAG: OmpA family protein [Bacteroidota bacterium]
MQNILYAIIFLFPCFAFSQELKPTEKEAVINVIVTDFSNKPRKGEIILLTNIKTNIQKKYTADSFGKFAVLLPKGESFKFSHALFSDDEFSQIVEIPNQPGSITATVTISMEFENREYTLDNVYFDFAKATLKIESNKVLNDLVSVMKAKESMMIELSGHTDNVGSPESNIKLSDDRAKTVKDYLVKNGITPNRITTKGYGDTLPIADNTTDEGRKKNRRTVVKIIKD